jgi:hypothetical protein
MEMGWEDLPGSDRYLPIMERYPTNVSRANIEVMSQLRKQFGQFKLIGQTDGDNSSS